MNILDHARATGEESVVDFLGSAREALQLRVRRSLGIRGTAPQRCDDPATSYLPVDGAARAVHGDLASMLVGGIASLLLQLAHPLVMTGVAQHSRYRDDPLGRLSRTASFVGTTTYGSQKDAAAAIARVRAVHTRVVGVTDDGLSYDAQQSRLLEWVHVSELSMFLAGVQAYGNRRFDAATEDQYVREMATVAVDLGVLNPPRCKSELDSRLEEFRPELRLIDQGREARDFVLRGVSRGPRRAAYATLVAAAIGILPSWARGQLEIPSIPLLDTVVVRPAATLLCATVRAAVPARPASGRDRQSSVDANHLSRYVRRPGEGDDDVRHVLGGSTAL